jgi:hypothetical protein
MEQRVRRDVADRFPFVGGAELAHGMRLMREDWATRPGGWIDERTFTLIVAVKPSCQVRLHDRRSL